jgi:hypothetical protein
MALMEAQLQRSFLGFRTGNQQLPCKVHAIPIHYYRLLHIYSADIDVSSLYTCVYIKYKYITLPDITIHYITLHYVTFCYITLHYITLHDTTLHYTYLTEHIIHTINETHLAGTTGSLTLLSMLSKGTWIHMVKSGAHSCRNVHQYLPGKFSLLELRISMKMLMGESYPKKMFCSM